MVSINSTSEEVRSARSSLLLSRGVTFPLIQLPKKSEGVEKTFKQLFSALHVSINSTSEEVRRKNLEPYLANYTGFH